MKKVKIIYNRKNCIGSGTCVNLNPDLWSINDKDAKAVLKDAKQKGNEIFILETESSMDLQMASDQCPACIIKLEEID